jgi:hypothetical protein
MLKDELDCNVIIVRYTCKLFIALDTSIEQMSVEKLSFDQMLLVHLSSEEVEVLGGGGGVDNVPVDVVAIDLRLLRVAHLKKSRSS